MNSHFSGKVWRVFFMLLFVIGTIWIPDARTSALQSSLDPIADDAPVGSSYIPQVDMTPIFTQVSTGSGSRYTCGVTQSGTVKCWGRNDSGQLGDGTTLQRTAPVDVLIAPGGAPLSDVRTVATGTNHACALMSNGGVKCWGVNYWGQLGNGVTTNSTSPVDVLVSPGGTPLTGVSAITASADHTCVQLTSGLIKCWGQNMRGELGSGTLNYATTPATVLVSSGGTSLLGVSTVTAGGEHTCALMTYGGVKCWGYNFDGQLGDNTNTQRNYPVDVVGLSSGVSNVSAGYNHTCAVLSNGGVKCWGNNNNAQLGDGTTTARRTPVSVLSSPGNTTLNGIVNVSAGGYATCALTTAAGAKCWGGNAQGNLGDGTMLMRSTAVDVLVSPGGPPLGDLSKVITYGHSCALTTSGGVKCWGYNGYGQLGDGTNIDRYNPVNFTIKTPQTITITLPPPASAKYGTSFTVAAISSSGLDVNYKSSGSCTNQGATFTMTTGVSTCTVTYEQPGDATYTFAPPLTSTVTAQKVAITVTADPKSKIYGDPDLALTYQITSGALVGTDTFTGALSRAAGSHVGTYAILRNTLALNTGRYTLTYISANLTITPRPITIQAEPKTKRVGEPDPALTYQITNGTLVAPDGFTGALSREPGEDIGSYAITQGNLSLSSDYALTYAGANLTILSNELTVTKATDTNDGICDNDCSLREAIAASLNGGVILFHSSLAGQTITLASTLDIDKNLTIDGSELTPQVTISGNNTSHIVIFPASTVTITDMTIADGYSDSDGGGIRATGSLTLLRSTLRNNYAGDSGGAIAAGADLNIRDSAFYQNQSGSAGGALHIGSLGSVSIVNTTIVQNQAAYGGAISILGISDVMISNSTIANNSATNAGGAIFASSAELDFRNSIAICQPEVSSCIFNSIFNATNTILDVGSPADFGLSDLGDHGGPTYTMALLPGSQAIDAGNDADCPAADQRGVIRPYGDHCDIGAYEYEPTPVAVLIAPSGTLGSWDNTFTWTGLTDAEYYYLQVYDGTDTLLFGQWFTNGICSGLNCAIPPAETQGLTSGDFKWRVQSYGAGVFGPWTEFMNFTINAQDLLLTSPSGAQDSWNNSFRWTGLSSAEYYHLELREANSDVLVQDLWFPLSICTGLTCSVSPVETHNLGNGDYKWRLQTYGSTGYTPWSEYVTFTLNAPLLVLNAPLGTLESWDKIFQWTGIPSAEYYHTQVYDATTDTLLQEEWYNLSICSGVECAVSPSETRLLGNGLYKWRVQTYGTMGYTPWSSYATFTINKQVVVLTAPLGTLSDWDKALRWTGIPSAEYYHTQMFDSMDTLVQEEWYNLSICNGLECAVYPTETQHLANGGYKWRVQTFGSEGYTSWTEFATFNMNKSNVMLNAPTGTLTDWDNTFQWTGISSAEYYHLQVYDGQDNLMQEEWYTLSICTGLDCAASPLETLNLPNGDYKWRVQSYGNEEGYTSWTDFATFELNR